MLVNRRAPFHLPKALAMSTPYEAMPKIPLRMASALSVPDAS